MYLHQGEYVITLTASGEYGQDFYDLAVFSAELESDALREEMCVCFCLFVSRFTAQYARVASIFIKSQRYLIPDVF